MKRILLLPLVLALTLGACGNDGNDLSPEESEAKDFVIRFQTERLVDIIPSLGSLDYEIRSFKAWTENCLYDEERKFLVRWASGGDDNPSWEDNPTKWQEEKERLLREYPPPLFTYLESDMEFLLECWEDEVDDFQMPAFREFIRLMGNKDSAEKQQVIELCDLEETLRVRFAPKAFINGENFEPNLDCPASRDWDQRSDFFRLPD